jgi:hypothetical protein
MKCYVWRAALNGDKTWTLQKSRSEITGKFWNEKLEKNGDQLDRLCGGKKSITRSQGGEVHSTQNKTKER